MRMVKVFSVVAAALLPVSVVADQVYGTDQGHTEVFFGWSHAGVSRQHAEFTVANGTLLDPPIRRTDDRSLISMNELLTACSKASITRCAKATSSSVGVKTPFTTSTWCPSEMPPPHVVVPMVVLSRTSSHCSVAGPVASNVIRAPSRT